MLAHTVLLAALAVQATFATAGVDKRQVIPASSSASVSSSVNASLSSTSSASDPSRFSVVIAKATSSSTRKTTTTHKTTSTKRKTTSKKSSTSRRTSSSSRSSSSTRTSAATSTSSTRTSSSSAPVSTGLPPQSGCYPNANAQIPATNATAAQLADWWCDYGIGLQGYSYSLGDCPSQSVLVRDWTLARTTYGARWIRSYSDDCTKDNPSYANTLVAAAAQAKVGLLLSVWFGYEGDSKWMRQIQTFISLIRNNPQAAWVVRAIAMGSEPISDGVLSADDLATQMRNLKSALSAYNMQITISDFAHNLLNNPQLLEASDVIETHILPMYNRAQDPSIAWKGTLGDIKSLRAYSSTKPIIAVQTGWASNNETSTPGRGTNVTLANEQTFFDSLGAHCSDIWKQYRASYLWHTFTDDPEEGPWNRLCDADSPGFGILDDDRAPKWSSLTIPTCA